MKRLFILSSILVLVGCTITKRQFNSGYHVEWNFFHSTEKNEADKPNLAELKDDSSKDPEIQLNSILSSVDSTDLIPLKNEELVLDELDLNETFPKEIQKSKPIEFQNPQIQEKRIQQIQDEVVDEVDRKVEPLTWFALGGIFFGIFLALISFLVSVPEIVWTAIVGVGLLVIIFSIISVIRILKHPEKYKGKGLTWTLFGLSAAGIGAVLFMLIYFILIATNNVDL